MCDLNWCPVCDKAIPESSLSLYCSNACLQMDALQCNPLLGYDFKEFKTFLITPTTRRRLRCMHNVNCNNAPPLPCLSHSSTTTTDDEEEQEQEGSSLALNPKSVLLVPDSIKNQSAHKVFQSSHIC